MSLPVEVSKVKAVEVRKEGNSLVLIVEVLESTDPALVGQRMEVAHAPLGPRMPVFGCGHRACGQGPCRSLSEEELTPTPEDFEFAAELIDEGWRSVSNKYREVARLPPKSNAEDLIKPEALDGHPLGRDLADCWEKNKWWLLRCSPVAEKRSLTVRQFRAFKLLGGRVA